MKIETERLILRDLKDSDAKSIQGNMNNLNVSKWLSVVPYPYSLKDAKWWVDHSKKKARKKVKEGYDFGIELKEEGKIIGGIGLSSVSEFEGTATLGYWLGETYWRKAYGTEVLEAVLDFAFKKLKLRRVEADVFAGNPSSGKLLENFGFKQEGFRKQAKRAKSDKKIKDIYLYGLLKEDYKN